MAGDELRVARHYDSCLALQHAQDSERNGHKGGLRIFSKRECVRGSLEDDAAELDADRMVDFFEHLPRGGEIRRQCLPHSDGLAALARKHKSDRHVLSVSYCPVSKSGRKTPRY